MNELLIVKNLTKRIDNNFLLKNVSFSLKQSGFYGLIGESGSGKTTLLYLMGLLDKNYEGKIIYKDLKCDSSNFIMENIGFVYQSPIFINEMTVLENLDILLNDSNYINALSLLEKVGLDKKHDSKVGSLSGGERMRLAFVRALINNPKVLLCDEPTASLNPEMAEEIMILLKEESKKRTVFVVSHDVSLLNDYADALFELKEKRIITVFNRLKYEKVPCKKVTINYHLKIKFILKYIYVKFKRKKYQTLICFFALMISFFTIGFSTLLKEETGMQVKSTFTSLIEKNQVLLKGNDVEEKNENITVSIEEAADIVASSNYFYDYNYLYSGDFESQFKTANYMVALINENPLPFFDVGLRTIAESIEVDDIPLSKKIYPERPSDLFLEECVLGLRKKDVKRLCESLNLKNHDVASLSDYLVYHPIDFCFFFQNESWNYNNEIILRMRAFFIIDERIIVAHTRKDFVKDFIEVKMKLPISSDLKRNEYLPWTVKRATYIRAKKEYEALNEYFLSDFYVDYDLQKIKGNLDSSFLSSFYHQGKYIVTYSGVGKRSFSDIEEVLKNDDVESVFPIGDFYPVLKEAMVSGFANTIFLTSKQESLDEVIDYYSKVEGNIDAFDLTKMQFSSLIAHGNLISAALQKGVKLETKKPVLKSGRYPESENEVVISTALLKKIFPDENALNERIYLAFHNYEFNTNSFSNSSLIVSGIYESPYERIYQTAYWYPIYITLFFSYPLESMYINSFICTTEKDISYLNEKYERFLFENPLEDIYLSVDKVIGLIQRILLIFNILLTISSFGILFITIQNLMLSAEKEIGLFKCLGLKNQMIFIHYFIYAFSYTLLALFLSVFMLLFCNFLLRTCYFKISFFNSLSIIPYLYMIVYAFILTLPLALTFTIIAIKKETVYLLKRYY